MQIRLQVACPDFPEFPQGNTLLGHSLQITFIEPTKGSEKLLDLHKTTQLTTELTRSVFCYDMLHRHSKWFFSIRIFLLSIVLINTLPPF